MVRVSTYIPSKSLHRNICVQWARAQRIAAIIRATTYSLCYLSNLQRRSERSYNSHLECLIQVVRVEFATKDKYSIETISGGAPLSRAAAPIAWLSECMQYGGAAGQKLLLVHGMIGCTRRLNEIQFTSPFNFGKFYRHSKTQYPIFTPRSSCSLLYSHIKRVCFRTRSDMTCDGGGIAQCRDGWVGADQTRLPVGPLS